MGVLLPCVVLLVWKCKVVSWLFSDWIGIFIFFLRRGLVTSSVLFYAIGEC